MERCWLTSLSIVKYPHESLLSRCENVDAFGPDVSTLISDMVETMYASGGIGLAAPQVGALRNIVVIDSSGGEDRSGLMIMVNPLITWTSPEQCVMGEGCLSIPGVTVNVKRSVACDVTYLGDDKNTVSMRLTGLSARIVQHEVDHLSGVLMIDKVGPLARRTVLRELKEMNEGNV